MYTQHNKQLNNSKQQGSVLIISMMILIAITLLTFTSSKSVLLQESMTANNRDDALALQSALATVADANRLIKTLPSPLDTDNFSASFDLDGTNNGGMFNGLKDVDNEIPCTYSDQNSCYLEILNKQYTGYFDESYWAASGDGMRYRTDSEGVPCGNGDPNCTLNGKYFLVYMGEYDASSGVGGYFLTDAAYDSKAKNDDHTVIFRLVSYATGNNTNNKKVLSIDLAVTYDTSN